MVARRKGKRGTGRMVSFRYFPIGEIVQNCYPPPHPIREKSPPQHDLMKNMSFLTTWADREFLILLA